MAGDERDVQEKLRLLRARVEEAVRAERFEEASELKAKEREVLGRSDEELEMGRGWRWLEMVGDGWGDWGGVVGRRKGSKVRRILRINSSCPSVLAFSCQ